MYSRLLPAVFLSAFLVTACAPDPEEVALEQYLTQAEELASSMSDMGTKLETLMNLQGNVLAWTEAEKTELNTVHESLMTMTDAAESMTTPIILEDIHPILIEAIDEMRLAVESMLDVANDPSKASMELAKDLEDHAIKAEELSNDYVAQMESTIKETYPELIEE